jgi:anti-anti-sigma factor
MIRHTALPLDTRLGPTTLERRPTHGMKAKRGRGGRSMKNPSGPEARIGVHAIDRCGSYRATVLTDDAYSVEVAELDIATAQAVVDDLRRRVAGHPGPARIVIDLSHVDFADAWGVGRLLELRNDLVGRGYSLRVRGLTRPVERAMEQLGVHDVFVADRYRPRPAD